MRLLAGESRARRWDLAVEGASGLWNRALGGARGSRSWHSQTSSGCRGSRREATRGVSDSDRADRAGLTTPTRSLERDTVHPCGGGGSIAASRSSTYCLAAQGWTDQQWSPGVAAAGFVARSELPLVPRDAEGGSGLKGESPRLGNGVFQRVLVTTSRLQRLVRGIFLGRSGGATALLSISRDSRTG